VARGSIAARRLVAPWTITTRRTGGLIGPWLALARDVARLVAIALRRGILLRPGALGTILFLEPIARILVRAAGTPLTSPPLGSFRTLRAPLARRGRGVLLHLEIVALGLARRPQLAAREPLHGDVGVLALQLHERRLQLLALARAERRRLVVDENCPVRVAGRHPVILSGSRRVRRRDRRAVEPALGTRIRRRGQQTTQPRTGTHHATTSNRRTNLHHGQPHRRARNFAAPRTESVRLPGT